MNREENQTVRFQGTIKKDGYITVWAITTLILEKNKIK